VSGAVGTDRDPLLRAVLRRLADWYQRWVEAGGDPDASGLRAAYRDCCVTLGAEVTVALPAGDPVTGYAVDVDVDGRLVLRTASGERALAAGDVLRVR